MKQYIDKAALVAEIKSIMRITFTNFDEGVNAAAKTLLESIDTLEAKEVDLEKEIQTYKDEHNYVSEYAKTVHDVAKHFFELGIKSKGE